MPQLKAVIFDMDGVLVDSEPYYFEVEKKLFEKLNLNIWKEKHNSFVGMSMKMIWTGLKNEFNLKQTVEQLIAIHNELMFQEIQKQENLFTIEGVTNLIHNLKKHQLKLAVATSTARKLADLILRKIEIIDYFDFLICGDEVKNGKPQPDIFLKVVEGLQILPEECVVIEDSQNGLKAAKKAGIKVIGYQNPNSGKQDLSKADLIIEHFSELNPQIIRELLT